MQDTAQTFTSISPTFAVDLIIGLPTIEGKMWAGKFEPAYPHLTNWNNNKKEDQFIESTFQDVIDRSTYPCSVVADDYFISFGIHRYALPTDHCCRNKMAATNFLNALSRDRL